MMQEMIKKVMKKEDLTFEEAAAVMNQMMTGQATPVQMAAFLTALSVKGESIEEITACAEAMRKHARPFVHPGMEVLEIVGTGGDGAQSFNISTTSAMVIAAGGVKVAKHGNRAASSKSGAADVLEALGAKLDIDPELGEMLLRQAGICFLFAQYYHQSMKYVAPVRKELGIRTIFNLLGPLTNPAAPSMQILGVYNGDLIRPLAEVLARLGIRRGMVVFGTDVLDEFSVSAPTKVCEIRNGEITEYTVYPEEFFGKRYDKSEIVGGTPQENARITEDVLRGVSGAKRAAVLLNAGAGLYIGGKADSLKEGVSLAAELIDTGKAYEMLATFVRMTKGAA